MLRRAHWLESAISDDKENSMSITEMEIQYGVLDNKEDVDAAFFFKKCDRPDSSQRLTTLKDKIRKRYTPHDYVTPAELCEKASVEVRKIIDKHFPVTEAATALDRERIAQRAYIDCRHTIYVENQSNYDRLNDFVNSSESYLVITGASGMGKSALIANWLKKYEYQLPCFVIYYFVGNDLVTCDYSHILQYICNEIYDLYGIEQRDNLDENLETETQQIILEVQKIGIPLLIVIDGINQIAADNDSKLLNWLPSAPSFVKYLFSTTETDESMNTFNRRKYPVYKIESLNPNQRKEFIEKYLKHYGKKLDENKKQITRILNAPETNNMLVLRTLLDELICFGSHEKLDERIEFYLSAESVNDFYDCVLQRMEQDYSANCELVKHTLSLIALSEKGLSEDELLLITGARQIDWSLFYCAFHNNFIINQGIITFSHQYIYDSIIYRYYIKDDLEAQIYRNEIIKYFVEYGKTGERKAFELAFQYYHLKMRNELYEILMNLDTFRSFYAIEERKLKLVSYWKYLGGDRIINYLNISKNGIAIKDLPYTNIGYFAMTFFSDTETARIFFDVHRKMIESSYGENCFDSLRIQIAIVLADLKAGRSICDNIKSYEILHLGEEIMNKYPDIDLSISFLTGEIYLQERNLTWARDSFLEAIGKSNKKAGFTNLQRAEIFNKLGETYFLAEKFSEARTFFMNALDIYEDWVGVYHYLTAQSYSNLGRCYRVCEDENESKVYLQKALNIRYKIFGKWHSETAKSLEEIGLLHYYDDKYTYALKCFQASLEIREALHDKDTYMSHLNVGRVYYALGMKHDASYYFHKAENKLPYSGHDLTKAFVFSYISLIFFERSIMGQSAFYLDKTVSLLKEMKSYNESFDNLDFAQTYINIGKLYREQGNFELALDCLSQAVEIQTPKLGNNHNTVICSNYYIADVYVKKMEYGSAENILLNTMKIVEEKYGFEHTETALSYYKMGECYMAIGKYHWEKAIVCFIKALNIRKEKLGDEHPETMATYKQVAKCYELNLQFQNSFKYYLELLSIQERFAQDYQMDIAETNYNIGNVLFKQNNFDMALDYFEKAKNIYLTLKGEKNPFTLSVMMCIDNIYVVKGRNDSKNDIFIN